MIATCSFSNLNENTFGYSVYEKTPPWFMGNIAKELCIDNAIYKKYTKGEISVDEYIKTYFELLSKLDPYEILKKYDGKIFVGWNLITGGKYLDNRAIIAEWIRMTTGVQLKELTKEEALTFGI